MLNKRFILRNFKTDMFFPFDKIATTEAYNKVQLHPIFINRFKTSQHSILKIIMVCYIARLVHSKAFIYRLNIFLDFKFHFPNQNSCKRLINVGHYPKLCSYRNRGHALIMLGLNQFVDILLSFTPV